MTIKEIIYKNCKHHNIISSYEPITNNTHREYQYCKKCGKERAILESLGHRVVGEWKDRK